LGERGKGGKIKADRVNCPKNFVLHCRLQRVCADLIAESPTWIFNASVISGIFPDDLKLSKVSPIFKTGGKHEDPNNYRPISVISFVAKLFERVVYNQLIVYINDNKLLSNHQSGLRSLHPTVTALLEATDNWALNIDQGHVNAVVFINLKKAFDTVNHV